MSVERQVTVGFALAILLVALTRVAGYRDTVQLSATVQAEEHSRQVLLSLTTMFSDLQDAETGQRGYLLTGDERYLTPYTAATARIPAELQTLSQEVADDPADQQALAALTPLVGSKLAELAETVTLRRSQGFDAAVQVVRTDRGLNSMDAIRAIVGQLEQSEDQELNARAAQAQASSQRTILVNVLGGTLTVVVVLLANLVIRRDVLQRRRATEELQRQYREAQAEQSQKRAVLDATSEAIALVAPGGRFVTVNQRFCEIFGVEGAAVVGRSVHDVRDLIARVFADPAGLRADVTGGTTDAEQRFTAVVRQVWPAERELRLYSAPVAVPNGEFLGRLYAFEDITREREVDRMKSEFIALVSHELRTPLTSIKGYLDLVLTGEAGPVPDTQREFLDIAGNNADRLVALIADLLDISRIEAGKLELHLAPVDLAPLLEQVLASLRPQFDSKRQQLTAELPAPLPRVVGDAERLTQVFTNLLSNAHKYTPAGGRINVSAMAEGESVRVDVRDSGIGLSPAEQAQLFTRFFRASNSATRAVGGTGLGLAITQSLVKLHGGEIAVTSDPGVGSTFRVVLPALVPVAAVPAGRSRS